MTTSTRLLALYDEARSHGLADPSARTYAARTVARQSPKGSLDTCYNTLADALADRSAGRSGSTLVRTAANAAPEVL